MALMRLDPFRELELMSSRLQRLFGDPMIRPTEADTLSGFAPPIDVEETDKAYLVKADLPEVKKGDIKVAIVDGVLSIEGERKHASDAQHGTFHRVEREYGKFVRRISVPTDIDQGAVGAEFADGVLCVTMPKAPGARARSIDVKVA